MRFEPVGQGQRATVAQHGGLRVTASLHRPDARLDRHAHRLGCATLMLGGGMRESFGALEVDCRFGGLIIKPPETRHSTRFGPRGARCLIVESPVGDTVGDKVSTFEALFEKVAYHSIDAVLLRRIGVELEARDTASEVVLEGLVLQVLGAAMRVRRADRSRGPGPTSWLSEVHDRVRSDFRSKLSIAGLAADAGVHPDHLARQFRRVYDRSIGDLMRELRLSWAAEQLMTTRQGLAEIALLAGFCDQSHFTRSFRAHFGMPPGRYRLATKRSE